jgi:hypothetical protein
MKNTKSLSIALSISLTLLSSLSCGMSTMALESTPTSDRNKAPDGSPARPFKTSELDRFGALSDQFIKEMLFLNPTTASQVGYHKHTDATTGKVTEIDAVLDDLSLEGLKKQREFFADWKKRFENETPRAQLDSNNQADWQLVIDQIDLQLLEFDQIQNYWHNPTVVVELIGSSLFQPLTEEYAPKDVRLGHILSRVEQIPALLTACRQYLTNADPIFISTAIEENDGNIDLIENTIGKEISEGSALKSRFDKLAPPAVKALKNFSTWLKDDLAKQPYDRSWRLGKDLYDKKFKLVMEAAITPDELLHDAEEGVKSVRAEMLELAKPLHAKYFGDAVQAPTTPAENTAYIKSVLQEISNEHCKRDMLQATIEADVDGIKQFIRDKKIVSLSERDNLKIIPTPVFMRGVLSVAAFHSAPALNPQAEAQYWVTPIDPKTPADKAESKLREYNNYTLKWLTIHEALPGHYVQFEHLNNLQPVRRRLLRTVFGNGAYVEGWAEYIAQVMMDQGYLDNDPRFRMMMRKIRLRLLANTIIDIKMQAGNMTDAEAMDLMTKETFQTQAEAEGKLKRAKLSSAQLATYYTGFREWHAFRKRYEQKAGASFDMLKFHNAVLDVGPLPVPEVEKLVSLPAH